MHGNTRSCQRVCTSDRFGGHERAHTSWDNVVDVSWTKQIITTADNRYPAAVTRKSDDAINAFRLPHSIDLG